MRRYFRWLQAERGSAMLEYLILVPMLVFLAFYPISTFVFQVQRNHLDQVKDRYLQEAQLTGGFDTAMWQRLGDDLKARGFDMTKVRFDGSTTVGTRVARGGVITLNVGYPQGDSQRLIQLIGLTAPDENKLLWVSGSILSEKP